MPSKKTTMPVEGTARDGKPYIIADTREMLHAWLASQPSTRRESVWLATWKKQAAEGLGEAAVSREYISFQELVPILLAHGWIDSTSGTLGPEYSMRWISPRRKGSWWSGVNKAHVERLRIGGKMTPQGEAVIAAAIADGSWTALDAIERLEVPADLEAAFAAVPGSRENWDTFTRSAKIAALGWIAQAKKPETRADRVAKAAEEAASGRRVNEWERKD